MDIKDLIGTEIIEQGKVLRITDVEIEGENIVLITKEIKGSD